MHISLFLGLHVGEEEARQGLALPVGVDVELVVLTCGVLVHCLLS